MQLFDYHVHSDFSDGVSKPEAVVRSALKLGLRELGFSDHSFSPQADGREWSMPLERYGEYRREISMLKEKYAGQIRILCGVEQDLDSPVSPEGFDYVIGSVHYLHPRGYWFCVDTSAGLLRYATETYYDGDPYTLCEDYYRNVAALGRIHPDLIGHFDLVSKFLEKDPLFSEDHPRYRAAQRMALDALLPLGVPFEINTGAISRGYRSSPYPCSFARELILRGGGRLVLSSDSHHADTLAYGFEKWDDLRSPGNGGVFRESR